MPCVGNRYCLFSFKRKWGGGGKEIGNTRSLFRLCNDNVKVLNIFL